MADTPLDFQAYRDLRAAAEDAERLILRLRQMTFELLVPDRELSLEAFGELLAMLETAPEIAALRRALGHNEPLPPPVDIKAAPER